MSNKGKTLAYTLFFGLMSTLLYGLLWAFEDTLLTVSRQGGWYFIVSLVIAFTFSGIHGAFTGYFWEALGITARRFKG